MNNARTQILGQLRHALSNPQLAYPPPESPALPLTGRTPLTESVPGDEELSKRFSIELDELHGTCDVAVNSVEARMLAVQKVVAWAEEDGKLPGRDTDCTLVIAWSELEEVMPGLADALKDRGFELRNPENLARPDDRSEISEIRIGITTAHAAFATTGSLLLRSGPGRSRVASLLPYYHLAVVSRDALWLNAEAWMAHEQRDQTLTQAIRGCSNVSLVSGPSKSADIESKLTLGVHGPRFLHAVIIPS